ESLPAAAQTSDSAIDLGADAVMVEEDIPAAAAPVKSDSAIDLGDDVIIEEPAPAAAAAKEESAIDLPAGAIDENVELPQTTPHEGVIDLPDATLEVAGHVDSGIDLGAVTPESGSKVSRPTGESGVDLLAEDVLLEEPASAGPASGGSGRDLIAEGL